LEHLWWNDTHPSTFVSWRLFRPPTMGIHPDRFQADESKYAVIKRPSKMKHLSRLSWRRDSQKQDLSIHCRFRYGTLTSGSFTMNNHRNYNIRVVRALFSINSIFASNNFGPITILSTLARARNEVQGVRYWTALSGRERN
jgi:hypothetical protein